MTYVRTRVASLVRFFVLAGVVGVVVLCVYLVWSYTTERAENERRALAEARVLNTEISAAWNYIDSIQSRINYSNDEFDFKGVYCAVAAKSIAKRFSDESEYTIRYVRENPRNLDDVPDAFERRALEAFGSSGIAEYYELIEDGDGATFRYVSLLSIEYGCLSCHGDPVGEKDATGYLKEGMAIGDIGGAVSIVMPMDSILAEARIDLVGAVFFFCVLMGSVAVVLVWGLRAWVTEPIMTENAKLHRESEDQSNFLTIITHELKTPLSSILAFTELWKEQSSDDSPERMELVDEVETNGRVLSDMINNVLDTARLEAGTLSLAQDELDVYDLAVLVKSTMGPLAKKKGVAFSIRILPNTPVLQADGEVLRRIVVNLVNNALRFTGAGGSVELSLGYECGSLVMRVQDTGIGIPKERLPHIFDRFVSAAGSETTSEGGTGLGLSIVRHFSTMMGGSVSVESEVGCGSVFTVLLPVPVFPQDDDFDEDSVSRTRKELRDDETISDCARGR